MSHRWPSTQGLRDLAPSKCDSANPQTLIPQSPFLWLAHGQKERVQPTVGGITGVHVEQEWVWEGAVPAQLFTL